LDIINIHLDVFIIKNQTTIFRRKKTILKKHIKIQIKFLLTNFRSKIDASNLKTNYTPEILCCDYNKIEMQCFIPLITFLEFFFIALYSGWSKLVKLQQPFNKWFLKSVHK